MLFRSQVYGRLVRPGGPERSRSEACVTIINFTASDDYNKNTHGIIATKMKKMAPYLGYSVKENPNFSEKGHAIIKDETVPVLFFMIEMFKELDFALNFQPSAALGFVQIGLGSDIPYDNSLENIKKFKEAYTRKLESEVSLQSDDVQGKSTEDPKSDKIGRAHV